jgi:hypothetical protein
MPRTKGIQSRVVRSEHVDWRTFEFLQGDSFKELSKEAYERLKASVLGNGFLEPFKVWQPKRSKTLYCLDGFHRCKVLAAMEQEGHHIPEKLPADFIDCKNQSEAAKLVLIYSSIYAHITDEGLYEFQALHELDIEALVAEIDIPEIDIDKFIQGWLRDDENELNAKQTIQERFIVPPFSVLDTRQGYWQQRKAAWDRLIGDHGETREKALYRGNSKAETHLKIAGIRSVSLLDAVLAEISVRWFSPDKGKVFDPFAGDTVFGFVAGYCGRQFTGIELRPEQADANNERVRKHKLKAKYICDDGRNVDKHLRAGSQDMLFSCPPYFNLERYSKLENDASNQKSYADFLEILREAFSKGIAALKKDRFAVIVVGDIRDERGYYRGFPQDVVRIFAAEGMALYNDIILLNVAGRAGMKVDGQFTTYRKVVKVHQNVLVFYKGDVKAVKRNFGAIDIAGDEDNIRSFITTPEESNASTDV